MDLTGFFGMNAALSPLMPLWQAGELGAAHAVSTLHRDKRSHEADPMFKNASAQAIEIGQSIAMTAASDAEGAEMMMADPMMVAVNTNKEHVQLAEFAAARLRGDTRIASFSVSGWDTHLNQKGGIQNALRRLSDTILTLRAGLGPVWNNTAVLCLTEFGRTAAENGTKGTDHGMGGAMIYGGGALNGGRVLGDWPGLAEADL